jgi:PAS domain S-box-containing protein
MSDNSRQDSRGSLADLALRVADQVSAMLAYWNSEQVCLFANEAYQAWFGKSRAEVVGSTMRELLGPLYELNLPYIRRALAGETHVFERSIPTPSGEVRGSLATYHPRHRGWRGAGLVRSRRRRVGHESPRGGARAAHPQAGDRPERGPNPPGSPGSSRRMPEAIYPARPNTA